VIYAFDDCELDLRRYELRRGGLPRKIEPQVFDVLVLLVRERDRVVTKEEILDTVWGDRFVSESALTSRIKALRQVIGDEGRRSAWCVPSAVAATSSWRRSTSVACGRR
jgi:DNA-binding winged helix-turn-helix (wHTH) protein